MVGDSRSHQWCLYNHFHLGLQFGWSSSLSSLFVSFIPKFCFSCFLFPGFVFCFFLVWFCLEFNVTFVFCCFFVCLLVFWVFYFSVVFYFLCFLFFSFFSFYPVVFFFVCSFVVFLNIFMFQVFVSANSHKSVLLTVTATRPRLHQFLLIWLLTF